MSDNILSELVEEVAEIRRMLASIHADIQAVKLDVEEFRCTVGQRLQQIIRTVPDYSRR